MRSNQKDDLRLFIELIGGIDLHQCDFESDEPDLIVRDGCDIGVEHTRMYREDPTVPSGRWLLPQEKLHNKLVEQAWSLFRQRSNKLLCLYAHFEEPFDYRNSDREREAEALASSVLGVFTKFQEAAETPSFFQIHSWEAQQLGLPFPKGVSRYGLKVVQNPGIELWAPAYGYAMPQLTVSQLEDVILQKERFIPKYRTRCDRIWLLIVTDVGLPSSHYNITHDIINCSYVTAFNRLFLLIPFKRRLIELPAASGSNDVTQMPHP